MSINMFVIGSLPLAFPFSSDSLVYIFTDCLFVFLFILFVFCVFFFFGNILFLLILNLIY